MIFYLNFLRLILMFIPYITTMFRSNHFYFASVSFGVRDINELSRVRTRLDTFFINSNSIEFIDFDSNLTICVEFKLDF